MTRKEGASVRPGLILWGIVFLCNPFFMTVDVLPDLIGWLLLLRGFAPGVSLSLSLSEWEKRGRILLAVSLARCLLQGVAFTAADSDRTLTLLLVLLFGLVDVIFALPAFGDLFDGLEYLSTRYGEEGKRAGTRWLCFCSRAFIVLRAVLNVLPEISLLSGSEEEYILSVTEAMDSPYAGYHSALLFFSVLLALPFCAVFLVSWARYLKKLRGSGLCETLAKEAKALPTFEYFRLRRSFAIGKALFLMGCLFLPGFLLDGYEILPAFAGCAFFLLAVPFFRVLEPGFRKAVPFFCGSGIASAVGFYLQCRFAGRYYADSLVPGTPMGQYYASIALQLVSLGLMIPALLSLRAPMDRLIENHCCMTASAAFERLLQHYAEVKKSLRVRFRVLVFLGMGMMLLSVVNYALVFVPDPVILIADKVPLTLTFWSFFLLLSIGWTVYVCTVLFAIEEQVEDKYDIYLNVYLDERNLE